MNCCHLLWRSLPHIKVVSLSLSLSLSLSPSSLPQTILITQIRNEIVALLNSVKWLAFSIFAVLNRHYISGICFEVNPFLYLFFLLANFWALGCCCCSTLQFLIRCKHVPNPMSPNPSAFSLYPHHWLRLSLLPIPKHPNTLIGERQWSSTMH